MSRSLLVVALTFAGLAAAQDPPSRAGRISYISGAVSFDPAGVTDWVKAAVNRPLTIGDQIYADTGGRAEVHVPGAAFRLGDRTAFEFMNFDDRTVQVRLSEGVLDLRVRNLDGNIEIDTPNTAFTVSRPGEYRLDVNLDSGQTLVTARDGQGQVIAGGGSFPLDAGQQAVIMGQDQSAQYKLNAAPGPDDFDRWVMSRNTREDRYARSNYVSQQMVGYEDLGEYGTWRSAPDYGQVWVPNGVAAGWAPYHDGHWAWVDPWGWTWVDDAPWGFAPFHYGRWAFVNGYWGWCPGAIAEAPIYAPALVAWVGFGAGFGVSAGWSGGPAVGWFPLGPRDVYIPSFTASAGFVTRINVNNSRVINTTIVNNTYNTYLRTNTVPVAGYMNRSVAGAIVAVPPSALSSARPVQQVAMRVQPNQIASIKAVDAAPRVAPQVSSVLGRAAGGNAPRPAAAVLSRPVVARTAPPPPPPSFQQRSALLARNPGRPVTVAQLHQLASSSPAGSPARPPVRVQAQVRPVSPPAAARGGAMTNLPANTHAQPPAAPQRAGTPKPAAPQHAAAPPQPARTPSRSFEPPAAQQRAATPPPPARTQPQPAAQQHASAPPQPARAPSHSFEPPAAQQRAATPPQPARTQPRATQPPAAQQHAAAPAPQRTSPPPAQHRPAAPVPQQAHQAAPPRPQPRVQAQQRPSAPPPQAERQAAPPREQPRPQAQPRPAAPPRQQPQPRPAAPPPPRQQPQKQPPPERKPEKP